MFRFFFVTRLAERLAVAQFRSQRGIERERLDVIGFHPSSLATLHACPVIPAKHRLTPTEEGLGTTKASIL